MAVADKLNELRIKANLIADQTVGLMEINVDVHDGVAVLQGEVESEEQKQMAEDIAYEVEGIVEVVNDLKVAPRDNMEAATAHLGMSMTAGDVSDTAFAIGGEPLAGPGPAMAASEQFPGEFDDEEIEREVRLKLENQDLVDASNLKVKCVNQIVHLRGCVNTPEDLYNLHDLVLNVRGVMGISSDVETREGEIGTQKE